MSIDTQYYQLYPEGLDTCLNCPLARCIWDADEPDRSQCPLERLDLSNSRLWQRNKGKIAAVLASEPEGVSLRTLSRKTGIGHQMLARWTKFGGAFEYTMVPRPGRQRGGPVYHITGLAG